jgi:hypothetical protein
MMEKKVTRRKYWVYPCFNKSGEPGSCVVARELDVDRENLDHFTG